MFDSEDAMLMASVAGRLLAASRNPNALSTGDASRIAESLVTLVEWLDAYVDTKILN